MKMLLILIGMVVCGCASYNTKVSERLTKKSFSHVSVGMTKKDVERVLGKEFKVYTHVIFKNGSGNNYPDVLDPKQVAPYREFNYTAEYSSPIQPRSDYRIYGVSYDESWRVIKTFVYDTE
jgi:hypothetical protein